MRNRSLLCCLLAISLIAAQRMPAQSSADTAKPSDTVKPTEPPAHFYRLDIVLEQVDANGKPSNSRSYATTVSTARGDSNTEIRTGSRVPITTGKEGENVQFQYLDVGVNIDGRNARETAGKLTLYLAADVSSVADAKEANGQSSSPVVEQNKWQGQVLIPIGKATTVFSSDDVRSKGSMRMVVTATLLQ